jgi:uncharacterized membrane protein YciS (DUF1049 family)
MQPLKIVITLVSLIVLAIVVGSNLSPIVTVTILSQPTVMLPVGVWFAIAIGLGLLSSSAIQLLLWLQNRTLTKKVRQLQTRLQDVGEDVFSYTPPAPPEPPVSNTPFAKDNFESRNTSPNFTPPPPVKPIATDDDDDWEKEPVAKPQPEWEDLSPPPPPPRQQTAKSPERSSYTPRQTFVDDDVDAREGVYDADFRLIQPPYKAPVEVEEEDDEYEYDDEDIDDEDLPPPPQSPKSTKVDDADAEDWGFDFDEKPPLQPPHF